jgi:DNA-binding transcriptional ArsR family regulator
MARRATPTPRLDPDIARLAGVLADRSRVAMLDALFDGNAHTIGSLARHAGITAATASGHLRRLLDEQLVVAPHHGRERRVRLASPAVAQLLESMSCLAGPAPPPITTASTTRARELRFARTCYDHLAGILGVRLTGAFLDRGWLRARDDSFTAAPALLTWLADHGTPLADEPPARRPLARACLDWSERTPHVAGRVGAAIADLALRRQWVVRVRGSRALRLTGRGRDTLASELAVTFS